MHRATSTLPAWTQLFPPTHNTRGSSCPLFLIFPPHPTAPEPSLWPSQVCVQPGQHQLSCHIWLCSPWPPALGSPLPQSWLIKHYCTSLTCYSRAENYEPSTHPCTHTGQAGALPQPGTSPGRDLLQPEPMGMLQCPEELACSPGAGLCGSGAARDSGLFIRTLCCSSGVIFTVCVKKEEHGPVTKGWGGRGCLPGSCHRWACLRGRVGSVPQPGSLGAVGLC